jgi:nucleoid-associated protein YgaU
MGLEKAVIKYGKNFKEQIKVLFNPSEYVISTVNKYNSKIAPGTDNIIIQFKDGGASTLSMTLYFDTYTQSPFKNIQTDPMQTVKSAISGDKEDVRDYTKKITELMRIEAETHHPPEVIFAWGSLSFKAVIKSVNETYTMFLPSGKPVRAKLVLSLMEADHGVTNARKNVLHSPDRTKQRSIKGTDQLWNMAGEEYDDPALWRVIAKENGILNPRKIAHGMVLKVPSIT